MAFFPCAAFLTDSAGAGEWIVLFVVILIVVGPKKLPEVVRKIGRTMEMFRRAADEFKEQLMSMDQEPTQTQPYAYTPPAATELPPAEGVAQTGASPVAATPPAAHPDAASYPGNEGRVAPSAPAAEAAPTSASVAPTDTTAKDKA